MLPIWEGTTNVLAVDVVRALSKAPDLGPMILARLDEATAKASTLRLAGAVDGLMAARYKLTDHLPAAIADPHGEVVLAGARELALTIGHALVGALLVEHAAATGDEPSKVAADLWGRSRLAADDIAVDAHRAFDVLCA